MAERSSDEELRAEVRVLTHRLEKTTRELGQLRIRLTSWLALSALLAALIVPSFSATTELGDDGDGPDITILGLVGEAGDADAGPIKVLALLTGIGLIVAMALTLAALVDPNRLIALVQAGVAVLLMVVWLALMLAVDGSEDGGFIDSRYSFDATVHTLLVPVGAILTLVAFRIGRLVRD